MTRVLESPAFFERSTITKKRKFVTLRCPGSLERTLFSVAVLQSERGKRGEVEGKNAKYQSSNDKGERLRLRLRKVEAGG